MFYLFLSMPVIDSRRNTRMQLQPFVEKWTLYEVALQWVEVRQEVTKNCAAWLLRSFCFFDYLSNVFR